MPKKVLPVPPAEFLRRVGVALAQLKAEPGGTLGWLVRFARENPAQWLPGDQEAHGYRLIACVLHPASEPPTRLDPRFPHLTPAKVLEYHAELSTFFRACVTVPRAQTIKIPATLRYSVERGAEPGKKPATWVGVPSGDFRAMLWDRVYFDLLGTDRLIACPTCGEPFLALRKRLFCSPSCLQKHHDRRKIDRRKTDKKGGTR